MDQFLCVAFAQLAYPESLRDIQCCLYAYQAKLYHMGFCRKVSKSTLVHANECRNWLIWADFAHVLIHEALAMYAHDSFDVELKQTPYAFDSTNHHRSCLSIYPWATFRDTKASVKAHTLLDLRGEIPCSVHVTPAIVHDMVVLDLLPIEPGSFYIMDRGYIDFMYPFRGVWVLLTT